MVGVLRSPEGAHEAAPLPAPSRLIPLRSGRVQQLRAELLSSEQRLQQALSDVLTANNELRVSNEEQQALNEELRVSNEELESSEGELHASNDELTSRLDELAQTNSDMRSVIESTGIAIVFLDQALRIRSFTPAVQQVMNLRDSDCGRAFADLSLQIAYPGMLEDARQVLTTHEAIERQATHLRTDARFLVRLLPYRGAAERVAGVVVTFVDVSATHEAEQALRASEERFRRMAAAVPALLFIAEPGGAWDYVNPPFYALTGQPDGSALGDGWSAALHPEDVLAHAELWHQAQVTSTTMEQEARLRRADGSWCWFLIRAVPQLDASGRVVRWYGSCTDIDDRRHAEKRQSVLLAQLQHRIKNILAVVRSVLTRTLESSSDLDHFATHLAGRIESLARTQSAAARTTEGCVMLEELVYQELAAHGGQDERQIQVEGPPVPLPAKTADTMGLAIHELTTNSIKYGALAVQSGRVDVRWRTEPDEADELHLILEWQESGVPLTDLTPRRRGFGRELIEQGLPYELGAKTEMEFRPGGMRCAVSLKLAALTSGVQTNVRSASAAR